MSSTSGYLRSIMFVGVMLMVVLVVGVAAAQEGSRLLAAGSPVQGTLTADAFSQTYYFDGVAGQEVTLFAQAADDTLELSLLLTADDGEQLAAGSYPGEALLNVASIAGFALPSDGRYYVTVQHFAGASAETSGDFTLTYSESAAAGADSEVGVSGGVALVNVPAGMEIRLSWESTADLDLEIRDPLGNSIYWDNPTASGAIFDRNINQYCTDPTSDNVETITYAPGAVAVGSYEVIVYNIQGCDDPGSVELAIDISVNGTPVDTITGSLRPDQVFLSSFILAASGQTEVGTSGVYTGDALADTASFLSGQTPIASDASVNGRVSSETVYEAYSFDGLTGDVVSIRMDALDGNLDPKLFLLDPTGNLVAVNDDAFGGISINAEIANQTLISDGVYTILATRYGQDFGGTEGAYSLLLSDGSLDIPPALAGLGLPEGSVEIALLWNTNADLQLLVRDPSGNAVYDDNPFGNSGGELAENGNVNCTATTTSPISYVYWPADRLPPGTYEVEVWYQNDCADTSPVTFSLTTSVNGDVIHAVTEQPRLAQVYLTSFTVDVNGNASAGAGGFIGDSSAFDVGGGLLNAIALEYGDTVPGTINQASKYTMYTFEGSVGDQVRIGMDATAGTLDTTLFLLSPDGAQLAANDDAVPNETTNSLIDNLTLPADGTYIIIATHYGGLYGGTSGSYNLSVVQLN